MIDASTNLGRRETNAQRVKAIFNEHHGLVHKRTDRMFAALMLLQWLAGVAAALWVSPKRGRAPLATHTLTSGRQYSWERQSVPSPSSWQ